MKSLVLPRVLGVLTLSYGGYTLIRPQSLARVTGLAEKNADRSARPSAASQALGRVVGTRDLLSGVAMIGSPAGIPLRSALIARMACDLSDAIGLGSSVSKPLRLKVVAITLGWAALCALSLRWVDAQR